MEDTKKTNRIHPLVAGAAVSVMLVSLTGVAALTGILPTSHSNNAPVAPVAGADAAPPITGKTAPAVATAATSPAALLEQKPASREADATEAPAPKAAKAPAPRHRTQTHVASNTHTASQPASQAPSGYGSSGNGVYDNGSYGSGAYGAGQGIPVTQTAPAAAVCNSCGTIEDVHAVRQAAKPSGLGIAAGAVLGGVLGNQVGNGNGRTLATIAGAVGGGYAGNEVESRTRGTTSYEVRVRMEDGSVRSFPYQQQPAWAVGERVRVVNGQLTSRG
ncbi:glycine zipper 2TM domain-containing protein [Noviherbaspirillum humi]|uniref:glycine zipper 2TM domain-containing protein n=1 Tax=Noviherbaspirillum humi TaxID=1688639 RepID=UPI001FE85300|nr:glycine zipper 2TM domain-containing protein [Noviherbaspirillum humi]